LSNLIKETTYLITYLFRHCSYTKRYGAVYRYDLLFALCLFSANLMDAIVVIHHFSRGISVYCKYPNLET